MMLAAYRARRRLRDIVATNKTYMDPEYLRGVEKCIDVLDEEIERVAEEEFKRPLTTNSILGVDAKPEL
jgi:hypothetical protein